MSIFLLYLFFSFCDSADVADKENVYENYQMQNQLFLDQVVNRQFDLQPSHYPSNNVAQNMYNRPATAYYPCTQPPYVNEHYDQMANVRPPCNNQAPYMPTHTYQHHHYHHQQQQQQQQQSHTMNGYANDYTAGTQHVYPVGIHREMHVNDSSLTYINNFNMPPNQQDHNAATMANHNHHRPADVNCDANLSNFSDMVQSTELFNAAMGISNPDLPDIGRLSSNLEAQLSID